MSSFAYNPLDKEVGDSNQDESKESLEISPSDELQSDETEDDNPIVLDLLNPETIALQEKPDEYHALLENITKEDIERTQIQKEIVSLETEIEEIQKQKNTKETDIRKAEKQIRHYEWYETSYKIRKFFHIRDTKHNSLTNELKRLKKEKANINYDDKRKEILEREMLLKNQPQTQETLAQFLSEISSTPLSKTEKEKYLKPEILSNLTTEQYIALWKRLHPHYMSHVTGYGLKEENDISASMGSIGGGKKDFDKGFQEALLDNKTLRPKIATKPFELKDLQPKNVQKFLENMEILKQPDDESAKNHLNTLLNESTANTEFYIDRTAIHFASNTVLDYYYGAESDNEIFVVYPTDVLASQHAYGFNGRQNLHEVPREGKWNDVLIWSKSMENNGIDIDAGIVFLPKSTMVDKNTGSKHTHGLKIPAQEYWENFFESNPETKPAHIIYYDNEPTRAVYKLLKGNEIMKPNQYFEDDTVVAEKYLEWSDNYVSDKQYDKRSQPSRSEFLETAHQLIDEHYNDIENNKK